MTALRVDIATNTRIQERLASFCQNNGSFSDKPTRRAHQHFPGNEAHAQAAGGHMHHAAVQALVRQKLCLTGLAALHGHRHAGIELFSLEPKEPCPAGCGSFGIFFRWSSTPAAPVKPAPQL